ncbi:hypothetical protein ACWD0A_29325 [Streptomyces sp. NPDC002867]
MYDVVFDVLRESVPEFLGSLTAGLLLALGGLTAKKLRDQRDDGPDEETTA